MSWIEVESKKGKRGREKKSHDSDKMRMGNRGEDCGEDESITSVGNGTWDGTAWNGHIALKIMLTILWFWEISSSEHIWLKFRIERNTERSLHFKVAF